MTQQPKLYRARISAEGTLPESVKKDIFVVASNYQDVESRIWESKNIWPENFHRTIIFIEFYSDKVIGLIDSKVVKLYTNDNNESPPDIDYVESDTNNSNEFPSSIDYF